MNPIQWPNCFRQALPKTLDVMESVTGSSRLDELEIAIDPKTFCLRLAAPAALLSYFSPYPILTLALSTFGLWYTSRLDYAEAKKDLLETKIAQIVSESAGRPKRALIIQSAKDEYRALSMRAHVEKVRELAKTHRIKRIIVNDKKSFLKSIPRGKFDLVWVRAHGTPTCIKLGVDFELNQASSPKLFRAISRKVKKEGTVLLECCNVGNASKAEANIAERIASYCWDATIYAPLAEISGIFGLEFDKWGYPQFNDGFGLKGRNITRIIEGPESQTQKSFFSLNYFY